MSEMQEFINEPDQPHQCYEYIASNTRCPETAILYEYFCFKHRLKPSPIKLHPLHGFEIPKLVDRDALQKAIVIIADSLAWNELDAKRASTLLYSIQLAGNNFDAQERLAALAAAKDSSASILNSKGANPVQPHAASTKGDAQ